MPKKYKLVETGEKSKVVTFRLGESFYSALEKQAQVTGGTVSATARELILESLGAGKPGEFIFKPGDTLKSSSDFVVMLTDSPMTEEQVEKRIKKLVRGKRVLRTSPQ